MTSARSSVQLGSQLTGVEQLGEGMSCQRNLAMHMLILQAWAAGQCLLQIVWVPPAVPTPLGRRQQRAHWKFTLGSFWAC